MAGVISHCVECHLTFTSVEAFDLHRSGSFEHRTRQCLPVAHLRAKGMTQDAQGRWQLPARDANGRRWKPSSENACALL